MPEKDLPLTPEEKLEAWRDEVEEANRKFRRRPRANLSRGAVEVAMKTEVKPTVEKLEST